VFQQRHWKVVTKKGRPPEVDNTVGQVKHDDRGNAVWQWANDTARSAIASTSQLMRKLDLSNLSLDSGSHRAQDDSVATGPEARARGGDPYASDAGAKRRPVATPPAAPAAAAAAAAARQPKPPRASLWQRLLGRGRHE
jgi:hypothetical protein